MLQRLNLVLGVACIGLVTLGCSDDEEHGHGEENPDLEDVVYAGDRVTDEALVYLLDRTPEDREAHRLVIDSPEADATLSKEEPTTIAYRPAVSGRLERQRRSDLEYATAPTWRQRAWHDLVGLIGPIKEAHAHGTPFNGLAYFLTITDADGASALRIFTHEISYTPTAEEWASLADVPQPLELSIISAIFEENEIVSGSGPWVGGSVEFSVE
jgi:hypothetical protein